MIPDEALATQRRMVEKLRDPARYPHPVTSVSIIETHISFVLLTGAFAYKIKKAVDLGFVDYTTLEKRRFFCNEELRLNPRLAPRLYLGVVDIGGTAEDPRWVEDEPSIEVAVKMAEFAQDDLLDRVLGRGELCAAHVDALAATIAAFHAQAPPVAASAVYGRAETIRAAMDDNFTRLRVLAGSADRAALDALEDWSRAEYRGLEAVFAQRHRDGFVRECHGDLHLGNIALLGGELQIFDGIEFNPALRWIDVVSDLAFLVMDLSERGRPEYAWRLLNDWLELSGDYACLALLRFYKVYRALVRVKVAHLRATEAGLPTDARRTVFAGATAYLQHALALIAPRRRALLVTHGFSGSGKSVVARAVGEAFAAVRLRSDVERKRQHGLLPLARTGSEIGRALYADDVTAATYAHLAELASSALAAGYPVVIDAACLRRGQRECFQGLARELSVPFVILHCRAPMPILRRRVIARAESGSDASEATLAVLERQCRDAEPLTADEQAAAITVDTAADGLDQALAEVQQHLKRDWTHETA